MMKRVLVPLDGSRIAESVLEPVGKLLEATQGTVVLFHAVTPAEYFSIPAAQHVQEERSRSMAYLERLAEKLGAQGIGVHERVVTGEPSREIVTEARRSDVDLIAMSTHGRSGIREWAFGSVAERVLRTTTLPVMVFRGRPVGSFMVRKMLVALDGTEEANEVIPAASETAAALGASIVIVHVGKHLPRNVEAAMRSLTRQRVPFKTRLLHGEPAPTILAAAAEEGADLLALTTAGKTKHDRLFFGGVAEAILKNADRPLLVVRSGGARRAWPKPALEKEAVRSAGRA